jgi:hypothetical protein
MTPSKETLSRVPQNGTKIPPDPWQEQPLPARVERHVTGRSSKAEARSSLCQNWSLSKRFGAVLGVAANPV